MVRDEDGETVGMLVLKPKMFSTGNAGWFGQGKLELLDGRRCQAQCQLVIIREKDDEAPGR